MTTTYAGQWGPEVLVDAAFHPLASATLTLYEDDGVTLATRYLNRTRTPAANPWTFLGPDNLTVFAEPNGYVLQVVAGATATLGIQVMVDPDDVALLSLVDAKGDLLAGTGNDALARLGVGVDGQVLTADASQTAGLKWAAGGGAGSTDVVGQILTATDHGLHNDARRATDGSISAGLATLFSGSLGFTTADIGKTVNVTIADVVLAPTGTVATGTAALTVTGHGLTSTSVGKTIQVDAAATGGKLLTTTISAVPDANTITLAVNAGATATSQKVRVLTPPLHTTISSVAGGVATLAVTASYAMASATVVVGTPNRAAFAALCSSAATSGSEKPVYLPPGSYMIELSSGSPNATAANLAGSLRVFGAGKNQTRVHLVHTSLLMVRTCLFNVQGSSTLPSKLDIADFSVVYSGSDQDGQIAHTAPLIIQSGTSNATRVEVEARRVDVTNGGQGLVMNAGLGTPSRRVIIEDCDWATRINPVQYFTNTGETDSLWHMSRSKMTAGPYPLVSSADFTAFINQVVYCHPNVGLWWENSRFVASGFYCQGVQYYSGSLTADVAPYTFISRCRFEGSSTTAATAFYILYQQSGGVTTHPHFEQCQFLNVGASIQISRASSSTTKMPLTVVSSTFRPTNGVAFAPHNIADGGLKRFVGCTFDNLNAGGNWLVSATGTGSRVLLEGCDFLLSGSLGGALNFATTNDASIAVHGGRVIGAPSSTADFLHEIDDNCKFLAHGVMFEGEFGNNIINSAGITGDGTCDVRFVDCRFLHTVGRVITNNVNVHNGNLRFRDCTVTNAANGLFMQSASSADWIPPSVKQPTAIASAATISPDWNHDFFDVSGTTTVGNILVGGTASQNAGRSGMLYVKPTGAFLIQNNAGGTGNIRTITGADITTVANRVYIFRAEPLTGATLWWQVGGPAVA